MARSRINSTRLQGGLGRRLPNTDGVTGFIMNAIAVVGGLQLGTIYELNSIKDLEALLINPAYDTTNKVLVYHHIERFFGRNPDGKCFLLCVAQTVTMEDMVDVAIVTNAKKLLKDKNGEIRILAVIRNPAALYAPTLSGGLDEDVLNARAKAQALIDEEAEEFRYLDSIILEGRSFNGTTASATDLRATVDYPGVSIVIMADNDISTAETEYAGYAAVGDFVGMLTKASLSQHPGEAIEAFNLLDVARGWFVNVGLSSAALLSTYTNGDFDTLDEKGYIYADIIPNLTGFWIQDTHTNCSIDSDYAFIENNRVINKMIRLANAALIRKAKARFAVDAQSGQLAAAVISGLEDMVVEAIRPMETDGDLSPDGSDAYLDPNVDVLAGETIDIELTAIPVVIGRAISLSVGFSNPFNR